MSVSTHIKGMEDANIFVDSWDDGGVWISIQHRFGGSHATLTLEEAKKMIVALQEAIEAQP